jgi:hypothetical protein
MGKLAVRILKSPLAWAVAVATVVALVIAWHATAYHRGRLMAHADHARGHYEVKAHGYVDVSTFRYARLLHERYGVRANVFGGCGVDSTTAAYEEGYTEVSTRLLNRMHGKDIFAECAVLSRPSGAGD